MSEIILTMEGGASENCSKVKKMTQDGRPCNIPLSRRMGRFLHVYTFLSCFPFLPSFLVFIQTDPSRRSDCEKIRFDRQISRQSWLRWGRRKEKHRSLSNRLASALESLGNLSVRLRER